MTYNLYAPDNSLLGSYSTASDAIKAAIVYQTMTGQAAHVLSEAL